MFTTPAGDPTAAVAAAGRTQDLFLHLVGRLVGRRRARHYGALLLTAAHGATSFESTSHFVWDKWHTNAEGVIDSLIALLPAEK
jgi:hypothetical protein